MMKIMKPLKLLLLWACCVLIAPRALSAQDDADARLRALFGDEVIARGTGFEIKSSALDESVVTIRASTAGRGGNISPEAMQRLEREVLRRLINIELLKQRATDEDRTKGAAEADRRIKLLEERAGSEEAMKRQLMAVGLTLDRLRAKLTEEATAEMVLDRELNIQISDEQVKTYYEENPARFEQPEMVRVGQILLSTWDPITNQELPEAAKEAKRHQIESILEKARRGDDFAELAVEYSEDTASKDRGGEYTFPRGRMVPEFEAVAFTLAPGKISDVVTTKYGYHIIKVYEKIPAKTLELNDEVSTQVKQMLKAREIQTQMGPYMDKLSKQAKVEILEERLRPQPGDMVAPPDAVPGNN